MTTRANSQFPRPDFHRQDKQPYGLRTTVREVFSSKGTKPSGRGTVSGTQARGPLPLAQPPSVTDNRSYEARSLRSRSNRFPQG